MKDDRKTSPGTAPGERESVEVMAQGRAHDAQAHGMPEKPWEDTQRDFDMEGMEEAADGHNYAEWGSMDPQATSKEITARVMAREHFKQAFECLRVAREDKLKRPAQGTA